MAWRCILVLIVCISLAVVYFFLCTTAGSVLNNISSYVELITFEIGFKNTLKNIQYRNRCYSFGETVILRNHSDRMKMRLYTSETRKNC
jgi:hypothetical protein